MTRKNIAIALILSATITHAPCSGMDYMSKSYNAATAMVANNMLHARNWTNNFIAKCRYVGVLPTLYATFGMYDFNKITGLDKNKLNNYNPTELENGMARINIMARYGESNEQLINFMNTLERQYTIAQDKEQIKNLTPEQEAAIKEAEELPYNEEEAIKEITKLRKEKNK